MAAIYKQIKSFDFIHESQDPRLSTSLKCEYQKILTYCTSRSLEEPLFQISSSYTFCSFWDVAMNEWVVFDLNNI